MEPKATFSAERSPLLRHLVAHAPVTRRRSDLRLAALELSASLRLCGSAAPMHTHA